MCDLFMYSIIILCASYCIDTVSNYRINGVAHKFAMLWFSRVYQFLGTAVWSIEIVPFMLLNDQTQTLTAIYTQK